MSVSKGTLLKDRDDPGHRSLYTIGLCLLSDYWNTEYPINKFEKLSDYRLSDEGLNLSNYWILDFEQTVGYLHSWLQLLHPLMVTSLSYFGKKS